MQFRRMLVLGLFSLISVVAISGAVSIELGPGCELKAGACLIENLRSGPGVVPRSLEPTDASSAAAAVSGPGYKAVSARIAKGSVFTSNMWRKGVAQ